MKVVLDTNVFISGIFFRGPPGRILDGWGDGHITLVVTPSILSEYQRVGEDLSSRYLGVELAPFLALLATHSEVVEDSDVADGATSDPDDDKFLACAKTAAVRVVVSGDRDLLSASGWESIDVLRPRQFVERFLHE